MEKQTIISGNTLFYVSVVGMIFGSEFFAEAVLDSFMDISQVPTDNFGHPGYIRIDSSPVKNKSREVWFEFVSKVRNGFLEKVSYGFSSVTKFRGNCADKVVIEEGGYIFSFYIKEYERGRDHDFAIVELGFLEGVPEEEELGRVVYLTISLKE